MTSERGWVPSDTAFAARLALVRHKMGWNAKEAALACGLSAQSWRNWETGGMRPHDYAQVCQAIAARTGANVEWLALGPRQEPITLTGEADGTLTHGYGSDICLDLETELAVSAA